MSNRHKRGCRGISYFHGITNEIGVLGGVRGIHIHMSYKTLYSIHFACRHLQIKSIPLTTQLKLTWKYNNKMRFPLIIIQMYFVNKQANTIYVESIEDVSLNKKPNSLNWEEFRRKGSKWWFGLHHVWIDHSWKHHKLFSKLTCVILLRFVLNSIQSFIRGKFSLSPKRLPFNFWIENSNDCELLKGNQRVVSN